MEKVKDSKALIAMLGENERKHESIETNCILTWEEALRLLRRKSLYVIECPAGLMFLDDEGDYYRVHFYLDEHIPFEFERMKKPVLVEFFVTGGEATPEIVSMEKKWLDQGFEPYIINEKIYRSIKDCDKADTVIENSMGRFTIGRAKPEHAEQIVALWRASLNPLNSAIPKINETLFEIGAGNIFCVLKDGEVCAVNKMVILGGTVSTWLGATKPKYRRLGLSSAMKLLIYKTAHDQGIREAYTWVDRDNEASVIALTKLGFKTKGEWTEGFILR